MQNQNIYILIARIFFAYKLTECTVMATHFMTCFLSPKLLPSKGGLYWVGCTYINGLYRRTSFKTHLNQFCYSTSSGHVQTVSTSSGHVHKASVGAVHLLSRSAAVEARTPILHSYNKGHVLKKVRNAGIFFK